MKRLVCLAGVFLLTAVSAQALTIESIAIAQGDGVTASYTYNEGVGTLNWSQGSSGMVVTDDLNFFALFNDISVTAQFTGMDDQSSGNLAKAQFSSGTWSMVLGTGVSGGPAVTLAGGLYSPYLEQEIEDGDSLEGLAIVTVTTAEFNFGYFGALWGIAPVEVQWGDGNGLGGMLTSVLFPPGLGIDDYQSGYSTENVSVTLIADEGSIPEPATLAILGLGALLMRKRRV